MPCLHCRRERGNPDDDLHRLSLSHTLTLSRSPARSRAYLLAFLIAAGHATPSLAKVSPIGPVTTGACFPAPHTEGVLNFESPSRARERETEGRVLSSTPTLPPPRPPTGRAREGLSKFSLCLLLLLLLLLLLFHCFSAQTHRRRIWIPFCLLPFLPSPPHRLLPTPRLSPSPPSHCFQPHLQRRRQRCQTVGLDRRGIARELEVVSMGSRDGFWLDVGIWHTNERRHDMHVSSSSYDMHVSSSSHTNQRRHLRARAFRDNRSDAVPRVLISAPTSCICPRKRERERSLLTREECRAPRKALLCPPPLTPHEKRSFQLQVHVM